MDKTNTDYASTSASDACTATQERICWNPINLIVEQLSKPRSEWICQKREKIKSPFRTTTSGFRFPSSFTLILRGSPPRLMSPSLTPQSAIPRERSTMRLTAIATSWCGVTDRRSHQSNTAAPMQQSIS